MNIVEHLEQLGFPYEEPYQKNIVEHLDFQTVFALLLATTEHYNTCYSFVLIVTACAVRGAMLLRSAVFTISIRSQRFYT